MTCVTVELSNDRFGKLTLEREVKLVDFADVAVRGVVTDRPVADGSIDETRYTSGRAVTLALTAYDRATANAVMRFASPRYRTRLQVAGLTNWPTVWGMVRGDGHRPEFEPETHHAGVTPIAAPFYLPDGVMYGVEKVQTITRPAGILPDSGRGYNLTHNRFYGYEPATGSPFAENVGTAPTYPIVTIRGPITGPRLINIDTGQAVIFEPTFTIPGGEFVRIDMRTSSVTANGLAGESRLQFVQLHLSRFFAIDPIGNRLRLESESFAAPARAELDYYPAYL